MRALARFIRTTLIGGVLVVIPVYLTGLLLVKALMGVMELLAPLTAGLPAAVHYRTLGAAVLLIAICFVAGLVARTRAGQWVNSRVERALLARIPGYSLIRGLTGRVVGKEGEQAFTVVLAEIEEALVPAFLVEDCGDERCVVFVPSAPTPAAGSIYIIAKSRVHRVDVPFTRAVAVISKWGEGATELLAGMKRARESNAPAVP